MTHGGEIIVSYQELGRKGSILDLGWLCHYGARAFEGAGACPARVVFMTGNDAHDPEGRTPSSGGGSDFSERLQRLNAALDKAQRDRDAASAHGPRPGAGPGLGLAMRLASEFVVEILVGGAIGWVIDHFAGTSPWGLLVFLLLGFAAGVVSLLRGIGAMASPAARLDGNGDGPK
jgi:ATP synthase protein I